ncbi:unnamed protein product [Euphydryas editha]|uniref:Breast cancer susceptibility 1 n=1 Tax=Euphydryas editha TaxID=104508 RepID=A0AAU9V5V1_EUPED|nr:unnamed protein product [Euphydryas editha]
MSKRTYLSGSQKRKKVIAQKEITEKLPKLTSFFTVEETNKPRDYSFSSPQDKSTSECHQEKEVTCDENDKHTLDAEPSTSSYCELITASLENVSVYPDPGTYCDDILPEEVRDTWIRKGPEFFQNKNSDFSETSTSFPDSNGKTKTRYLTKNIFIRKLTNGESLERIWLLYSPAK